jgi:hypothetical protein
VRQAFEKLFRLAQLRHRNEPLRNLVSVLTSADERRKLNQHLWIGPELSFG